MLLGTSILLAVEGKYKTKFPNKQNVTELNNDSEDL